jgi:hypothetical protein
MRPARRALKLILLWAACGALVACGVGPFATAPSPTPTPVSPSAVGVEVSTLSLETAGFQTGGSYWVRVGGVWWPDLEPEEGARNWESHAAMESELRTAAALGHQAILMVRGTPAWAQAVPGSLCSPIRPDKLDAFTRMVADVVTRYKSPPYNVHYWEFGNEEDLAPSLAPPEGFVGCWGDEADPGYGGGVYAGMLRRVYPVVKAADPEAQVLLGGLILDCNPNLPGACRDDRPSHFFEGVLQAGGGESFDGVSFHAYDYYGGGLGRYGNPNWDSHSDTTGPVLAAKAQFLQDLLDAYQVRGKFLMATEVALLCGAAGAPDSGPGCQAEFEFTKAYYLAQAYAASASLGLHGTLWYSRSGWRNTILFNPDQTPRPALRALQVAVQHLGRAEAVSALGPEQVGGESALAGYSFRREGHSEWLIWARDRQPHPLALPAAPASVSDVFGVPVPFGATLDVGVVPYYVEWPD